VSPTVTRDASAPERAPATFWVALVAAVAAWIGAILALVASSPRLVAAFHGFLHSGVASRFPSPTFVPENPFFAGEPLRYYWFYQWLGSLVSRALAIDQIHAFQTVALASLALLVATAALAGWNLYRSTAAGLMIGYLALVGMNPLGPAIAIAKVVLKGEAVWEHPATGTGGDIFVTNQQADDRLARPLLGALHIGTDWQSSQDIVWFFDVSSRGPSIALLMVLAWLMTRPRRRPWTPAAIAVTGGLATALNPIVGFSVAGTLMAAAVVVRLARGWRPDLLGRSGAELADSAGFLAGVVLAWPIYRNMFAVSNTITFTFDEWMVVKTGNLVAGFLVLLPLALWGVVNPRPGTSGPQQAGVASLTLASLFLIGVVPFVTLYEINQHNFVNAASCLLAVPAASWLVGGREPVERRTVSRRAWLLVIVFLPMTIGLFLAFAGRGDLPLRAAGGELRRLPVDGPLDAFYQWARRDTPVDAVLVVNADRPVKMSGNVTEIPALSGRAVFVDHNTYMVESYPALADRTDLARRAADGQVLTIDDRRMLDALARPVYIVNFEADRPEVLARLRAAHGAPVFERGFVAAFRVGSGR